MIAVITRCDLLVVARSWHQMMVSSPASHGLESQDEEKALLDLAADTLKNVPSLNSREELILQLHDQLEELELENAVLKQGIC